MTVFFRLFILIAVLSLGHTATAQDALPPLIDRELFFGDPEISGAQLSPDGQFIAFMKPYEDARNIWVKGLDEPFDAARPITADARPVAGYFWSRDSRYVLYAQDKGGNENFHVYAVEPGAAPEADTGVPPARDLTPYENTQARIFAVPEATPNTIIVGLNDRDPALHDVYRVNLETGDRTLIIQNEENVAGWLTDRGGTVRLGTRLDAQGGTEILRVDGDALVPVYQCNQEETCGPVRFHQDGQRVYMITNKGDDVDLTRLLLFNPETGEETFVEADPERQVDFGGAEFSEVTGDLLATYYNGDRLRIYPKDDAFARDLAHLREQLPEGEIYLGGTTADERMVLLTVTRDVDPGSRYLYNRDTGTVELLYRSRPELPTEHLAEMQAIRYPARDGLEIPAYLTLPKGAEATNLPVVMLPHGGPWARDGWGYDAYAQYLANRGYAVLQMNFRGSTGYGKAFLNAGNGEWGTGAMQHDITDGVQYLIDQGIADPERVGIFGGSYGGYATLAGLAFTPDLYAAGVSYVGPSNLLTLLESIPPYWGPIRKIFDNRLGDPTDPEDLERLKAQSPLFSADQIEAPLLVIQGANDPRVKEAESEQIVIALRDLNRKVAYMVADDEGHGFRGDDNRLAVAVGLERFLADNLGGRYQDEVSEELAQHIESLMVDINTLTPPETMTDASALPAPLTDGSRLEAASFTYDVDLAVMGQQLAMTMSRTIDAATHDGQATWQIVDAVQLPAMAGGGMAVDTFTVDKNTLKPLHRHADGQGTMTLTYTDAAVTGTMASAMGSVEVNVALDQPVLGDGPGLILALAGMPLADGYETVIHNFEPLTQKVRPMKVAVAGTETLETAAGSFATFVVQLTPLDGDESGTATLHLMQAAPHYVVQGAYKLPAAMGSGTMTTTLTTKGTGGSN